MQVEKSHIGKPYSVTLNINRQIRINKFLDKTFQRERPDKNKIKPS